MSQWRRENQVLPHIMDTRGETKTCTNQASACCSLHLPERSLCSAKWKWKELAPRVGKGKIFKPSKIITNVTTIFKTFQQLINYFFNTWRKLIKSKRSISPICKLSADHQFPSIQNLNCLWGQSYSIHVSN